MNNSAGSFLNYKIKLSREVRALISVLVMFAASLLFFAGVFRAYQPVLASDMQKAAEQALQRQFAARSSMVGGETLRMLSDTELLEGISEVYGTESGAVVTRVTARGFESDITLDVGVGADGAVSGISVISHGETPDKGGQALLEEYLSTYIGAEDPAAVDVYSGATYTSHGVQDAVSRAINQYKLVNGIEFERELTDEQIIDAFMEEVFAAPFEEVECEKLDMVNAVYKTEGGYGFFVQKDGYFEGLPVKLLVCTDNSGIVRKVKVISQSETPGNGDNAFTDAYLFFYEGDSMFLPGFSMPGMPATQIDMISGATHSCMSVYTLVDAAMKQFRALP